MDDHTIFIRRKTRVNALVLFLSVVNIKPVFFHLATSQRERGRGRFVPLNFRGGVSKKVTFHFCFCT